jgi:hypothetical protein
LGDQDQLFFSRNIGIDPVTGRQVPVNGGAKLTGTIGRKARIDDNRLPGIDSSAGPRLFDRLFADA